MAFSKIGAERRRRKEKERKRVSESDREKRRGGREGELKFHNDN